MIKVIIVDDEPLALDIVETYLEQIPDFKLIGKCSNALEARDLIKTERPDVIFLDIEMPGMTGIELAKTLTKATSIVFTTAYPNFAHEGFELDALDYLLKPISFDRFMKTVEKIKAKHLSNDIPRSVSTSSDYIFVKADKKFIKINFSDIWYVEGLKDYVIIKTGTGRIVTLQTMKSLEDRLPKSMFMRIHRSYIVNLKRINAILGNLVEIGEKNDIKQIPIGKNYRDDLSLIIEENRL
jgi:DNA-binding LytR/AlgR family response regulator